MPEEKLTPSILYTTEAEESKEKTEKELGVEDPDKVTAEEILERNKQQEE
tara:strand:+ start:3560 stop:3709 length:150 start_codon:yes stop_codon:yes gene_type:complete